MTKKIAFTDIDVSADGWVRCNVTRETTEQFRIQLPYSFNPSPDLIAASYAAICGSAFDEVEIDLPIGADQSKVLETSLRANLIHRTGLATRHRPGTQRGLNFSGGFDSLAAREILQDSHLISLDFGGRFSRERAFFDRFDPLVFRTNLVSLGLNAYDFQFMGVGAILLRDELQLGAYSFGSIMSGSLNRLFSRPLDQSGSGIRVANALGMRLENPVSGITEIAALHIVAKNHPELLSDALMSVALPNEDKFQRKYQMLEAVSADLRLPTRMPEIPIRNSSIKWGGSFATDLSSLYVIQQMGADYVASSYANGIPQRVVESLPDIDLSFMTRINPHAYAGVRPEIQGAWYKRLVQNGMVPFERQDWFDAAKVMNLLKEK